MRTTQQAHCSAWGVKKVTLARLYSTRNRKGTDLWPMSRIGVRQTPGLFCSIWGNQIDWAWSMQLHTQTHQKLLMQGWFYWPCCSKVAGSLNGEKLIYARACRSLQEVAGALQEFVQCADTYNNSSPHTPLAHITTTHRQKRHSVEKVCPWNYENSLSYYLLKKNFAPGRILTIKSNFS